MSSSRRYPNFTWSSCRCRIFPSASGWHHDDNDIMMMSYDKVLRWSSWNDRFNNFLRHYEQLLLLIHAIINLIVVAKLIFIHPFSRMIPVFHFLNAGCSHQGLGLPQRSCSGRVCSPSLLGSKSLSKAYCLEEHEKSWLIASVFEILECIICIGR